MDADMNVAAIVTPTTYTNVSSPLENIYVRLTLKSMQILIQVN